MIPDPLAILAVVLLLLPQAYFLFASPSFLFVSLAIPGVTVLLRVLFGFYLRLLQMAAGASALAFALSGRFAVALVPVAVGGGAILARSALLAAFDTGIARREAGDAAGVERLRQLHWLAMTGNLFLLAGLLLAFPRIVTPS
ncbi:hypothetical protein [Phreatobacter oligotrophus]|uniref:hypothetical protein n=1 Tax=Phreatobacter oligotrophus TaxID=1122261 RepID=UPI00235540C1|nr:hypothetical protein [Phreatobacter oligotrophus]MBX9991104.1 hypothetical protein [Phreatobacter oligotrophus]